MREKNVCEDLSGGGVTALSPQRRSIPSPTQVISADQRALDPANKY